MISWDEKHNALFETHNWGKSCFFQHARSCICTVIHKYVTGVAQCAPPGLNRVKYNSLANICLRIYATAVSLDDEAILEFIFASWQSLCVFGFIYGPY